MIEYFGRETLAAFLVFVSGFLLLTTPIHAQWMGDYLGDESVLYAETKQVNQFFRRFNGEEGPDGKRYYSQDQYFRNPELRKKYLQMLFDHSNPEISNSIKEDFISDVLSKEHPDFLNFHGGEWFAEVKTSFLYKGKREPVTLFLKLEEADVGSKWVFTNIYFQPFNELFQSDEASGQGVKFLHPMSHELDFMNLIKVFRNQENLQQYALKNYQPDFLTLFLYEMKRGNLSFKTVNSVKFHFFQIDNWYFELRDIQREGKNRGWLISQIVRIPPGQKELLMKFIYHQ